MKMGFQLTSKDYADYIRKAYKLIHENGDYITELDSATGDGDHWTNINMGFESLVEAADELEQKSVFEEFKQIGTIMMSVIGGSSGVLYGSAYLAAAKVLKEKETIGKEELFQVLEAMLQAIMSRGNAQVGWKTMIDCLAPAVDCYRECITNGVDERTTAENVKQAAIDGAQNTMQMEAVRGRATYQANKGVGHLDPGAVTMSYQIATLMDCVIEKLM
jgi:dihydroxyacetone kinase-like protein